MATSSRFGRVSSGDMHAIMNLLPLAAPLSEREQTALREEMARELAASGPEEPAESEFKLRGRHRQSSGVIPKQNRQGLDDDGDLGERVYVPVRR